MASIVVFGPLMERLEPTERNSNLLPVKANGLVLFLSVESFGIGGSTSTPMVIFELPMALSGVPSLIDSRTA